MRFLLLLNPDERRKETAQRRHPQHDPQDALSDTHGLHLASLGEQHVTDGVEGNGEGKQHTDNEGDHHPGVDIDQFAQIQIPDVEGQVQMGCRRNGKDNDKRHDDEQQ